MEITMLKKLTTLEQVYAIIQDDPVRPHIAADWRIAHGREVYTLVDEHQHEPLAVICVAYCDDVPTNEADMNRTGDRVAVFYTVWSYSRGAGRTIVNEVFEHLQQTGACERYVTLSPLTEMAERFHIKNGAQLLARHNLAQNFEYS
jgi:uncharacterized protein (UPF0371 family)